MNATFGNIAQNCFIDVLDKVNAVCYLKKQCSLIADTKYFGNGCSSGITNTLYIQYECLSNYLIIYFLILIILFFYY